MHVPAYLQGGDDAAWATCSSGIHSVLELLASLPPTQQDAVALAAVVRFLCKASTISRCSVGSGERSHEMFAWIQAALASGAFVGLRMASTASR